MEVPWSTLKSDTLLSKATGTSKTFIVPKVFIFKNPDWFCLKAHNLPFIHAEFHSSGSSSLACTEFGVKMWKASSEAPLKFD